MARKSTNSTIAPSGESPNRANIYIHEKRCKRAFARVAAPAQHIFMMIVDVTAEEPNRPITCDELLLCMGYPGRPKNFPLWINDLIEAGLLEGFEGGRFRCHPSTAKFILREIAG
jgi:hypothetical protein